MLQKVRQNEDIEVIGCTRNISSFGVRMVGGAPLRVEGRS